MKNNKTLSRNELYDQNTIGIKLVKENRSYSTAKANEKINKSILRTKYLKLCCSCGTPYESYKYNSYACSHRCRQNIIYRRKQNLNPLGNLGELTKPKNVKEVKDRFNYI